MYWAILLPLLFAAASGLAIWADRRPQGRFNVGCAATLAAVLIVCAATVQIIEVVYCIPRELGAFERQSTYIQTHEAKTDAEDAAITSKKIELNEWLYKAQYSKEHYGGWSLYPERVLELTPIE